MEPVLRPGLFGLEPSSAAQMALLKRAAFTAAHPGRPTTRV